MWGLDKFRLCNIRDEFIFINHLSFLIFKHLTLEEIVTEKAVVEKIARWSDIRRMKFAST